MPTLNSIIAALNDKQIKQVNKWPVESHGWQDHAFGGSMYHGSMDHRSRYTRVTVPLEHVEEDVEHHPDVKKHLEDNGYQIHNYKMGIATDKHGRQTKIGKALAKTKASPEIIKAFTNDPKRGASNQEADLRVTFSRHPHDVAAASTGQGWTSCMNMDGGMYSNYLKPDVKHGTIVAYLHHKDDKDLDNPLARISLKPYSGKSKDSHKSIAVPERNTYGTGNDAFTNTVHKWANEHFPIDPDVTYHKNKHVYDDGSDKMIMSQKDLEKAAKTATDKPTLMSVLHQGNEKHHELMLHNENTGWSIASDILHRYPKLADKAFADELHPHHDLAYGAMTPIKQRKIIHEELEKDKPDQEKINSYVMNHPDHFAHRRTAEKLHEKMGHVPSIENDIIEHAPWSVAKNYQNKPEARSRLMSRFKNFAHHYADNNEHLTYKEVTALLHHGRDKDLDRYQDREAALFHLAFGKRRHKDYAFNKMINSKNKTDAHYALLNELTRDPKYRKQVLKESDPRLLSNAIYMTAHEREFNHLEKHPDRDVQRAVSRQRYRLERKLAQQQAKNGEG